MLGPEADLLASADAAGLGASTLAVLRRAALKPGAAGTAALRYWTSLALALALAAGFLLDAAAPTNFLATNPGRAQAGAGNRRGQRGRRGWPFRR